MTEELEARLGEELVIALDANPTTGYSWEATFDQELVALLRQEYRRDSELIGSGGKTIFVFRPVRRGQGTIVLSNRRPWEPEAIETRTYAVTIA